MSGGFAGQLVSMEFQQHVVLEPQQAGGKRLVATFRQESLHSDFHKRKVGFLVGVRLGRTPLETPIEL